MPCEHCGKLVYIAKNRQSGFKYCSRSCHGKAVLASPRVKAIPKWNYGEKHHNYKGGYIRKDGYKFISVRGKQVYEHRVVMEKHLGRKLSYDETIHHIDGNRLNNDIENLELMSRSEHTRKCHCKYWLGKHHSQKTKDKISKSKKKFYENL